MPCSSCGLTGHNVKTCKSRGKRKAVVVEMDDRSSENDDPTIVEYSDEMLCVCCALPYLETRKPLIICKNSDTHVVCEMCFSKLDQCHSCRCPKLDTPVVSRRFCSQHCVACDARGCRRSQGLLES